jgi:predicted DNA-binding transcriptional regulator YafY
LIDTPLSIQQRVEHLDAQTLKIQVELPLTPKLTWWLTSFGPDIEVLGPASLRAALAARHRRAAEYYANG